MKQTAIDMIRLTLLLLLLCGWSQTASADDDIIIRYVSPSGAFQNGGTSWTDAKNNLQNAIDDIHDNHPDKKGYVYVKGSVEGTEYVPSRRSTDDADGSAFNTSFRIYGGIYVYGGFNGDEEVPSPSDPYYAYCTTETELWKLRVMDNRAILGDAEDKVYAEVEDDIDKDKVGQTVRRWNFKYKTVLTGSHSTTPHSFRFEANRGIYSTSFPLNSYHVVWFGTEGPIVMEKSHYPSLSDDEFNALKNKQSGHYKGLSSTALVDGCTIEGGYASSTVLTTHEHTGFGGGAYLVRNAMLRNCIIHHCSAMQRGGGVYMDGGGVVERCYIHTCQTTGYGMQQGYGGGVCIDYDGSLQHSYVIQSAARIGAGLAICHVPGEYPELSAKAVDATFNAAYATEENGVATPYNPHALSTVIGNCTSNAEGAGVYLDEGGTLNHCSVVNNKCIGPDVIYYGRRHGRTGGIYVRNGGTIYNSVAWGNECPVNNDVQFAAFKEGNKDIRVYHSAFSKSDITDWAAATKENVYNLENANFPSPEHKEGNFPMFKNPTVNSGVQYETGGAVNPAATGDGEAYQRVYNWHPLALSDLRGKAVQVTDAIQDVASEIVHAHTEVDVVGRHFEAVSSCGALAHSYRNIQYALMPSQEKVEGRLPSEDDLIPTLFVDPNLLVAGGTNDDENTGFLDEEVMGNSWTHPMSNLADAIFYFKDKLKDTNFTQADYTAHPERTYYDLPESANGVPAQHYSKVQILVKEGKLSVAGQGSYVSGSARTASLRPGSNMRIYGAFSKESQNQDQTIRNPFEWNSDVTANVLGGIHENNSVHVVAIANQHDVIFDGFRLHSGNANVAPLPGEGVSEAELEESRMYHSLADGGGIVVNNAMTANPTKRRDMTGNILRNVVITNCAAPEGAAIYVSGGFNRGTADGSAVADALCRAELTMVNVIVRNCTAGDIYGDPDRFVAKPGDTPATMQITLAGICTANGNGKIVARNCDIMNCTGFPFKCDSVSFAGDYTSGNIEAYNTVTFSNGLRVHEDRSNITNTVFCPKESWYKVSGKYLYMGYDVLFPADIVKELEANHIYRILTHNKNDDKKELHTRVDDGSQQGKWGDDPSLSDEVHEQTKVVVRYPTFVNPSRNVGHSTGDDQSYYGGRVNYEPLPTNPIVNAGCSTIDTGTGLNGTVASMSYDMGLRSCDYGGDPDIGAIETLRLPKAGSVLYVTPEGAGRRDGSSWANAIQGNAVYALSGGAAGTDEIDPLNGARITNTDPAIGSLSDGGVPTTDDRYCGFAQSWFKERRTGAVTTTTVTDTWTIEKNVYDDGDRKGDVEIIRNDTEPTRSTNTVINNEGTAEDGFSKGWADDERYPYGELSGQSRAFWRAKDNFSPIPEWWTANSFKSTDSRTDGYTGETVTGIGGGSFLEIIEDETRGIKIRNNREEHYVGGLQYAVEKAASYNALAENDPGRITGIDSIQVWVSNGTYTDYKGFIMRDNTTVLGSFPAADGGTPGLNERQALMSAVIDIPKSLPAKDLNPEDYETILQISDVDPKADNENMNMSAVKFWDDDYSKLTATNTTRYAYKKRTVTHHFSYYDTNLRINKTDDYVQYSDMTTNGSTNVWASPVTSTYDGTRYYTFGTATGTKDCWHISVPNDNVNKRIGNFAEPGGDIYENGVKVATAGQIAHIRDGSLTDVNIWQTLKTVPVGSYIITIDMAAFYYDTYNNLNGNGGNPNTNVTLQILDADDNVLSSLPISYYNTRRNLNRYTLAFTQETVGDVTVKVVVGKGLDRNGNIVEDDYTLAMNKNPNRREINMDNLRLYQLQAGESYTENLAALSDELTDYPVDDPQAEEVSAGTAYTVTKHRTTLRKRVLQMPDKANPVYCGGSYFGDQSRQAGAKITENADHVGHAERVNDSRRKANNQYLKYSDPDYDWYTDAIWDGFTIRHGFIHDFSMTHGGGAGVSMYEGGRLRNCVIINNIVACEREKGGGVFVDGSTSSVEGCFILNNSSTGSKEPATTVSLASPSTVVTQVFAGGLFMYEGTCYNTLIANNYSLGNGGGLGLCVGRFYNNTIAYNVCGESNGGGGMRIATGADSYILMANSIIYGNSGYAISMTSTSSFSPFLHCLIQSTSKIGNDIAKYIMAPKSSHFPEETEYMDSGCGWRNKFYNGVSPSLANTPFEADVKNGTTYTGDALTFNDYRLREDFSYCINKGTEDFKGTMYNALSRVGTANIESNSSYVFASNVDLPDNDVAFAERVQDCQVDMGAYEFDGTRSIEPSLFPNETPKKAVFYVTQNGAGLATAETPANAACYLKLQKVLDAAGRWRYASYKYDDDEDQTQLQNNVNTDMFRQELKDAGVANDVNAQAISNELRNLKDYEVIVRLEGDNGSGFKYIPTRSTNLNTESINEMEKSLIVPHGVRIEGGYNASFNNRDILGRPSRFSGEVENETLGTTGNVYHVVTFTNDLFDVNEQPFTVKDGSNAISLLGQLEFLGEESFYYPENYDALDESGKADAKVTAQAELQNHRTVLDGLFIQDGHANGTSTEHQRGAGATVTEYAHIRNCVIQDNTASKFGGGLYLLPQALVSGCIVKNNSAQQGGGMYVEEPLSSNSETYVHIISSTVVDNEATLNAGGLWFQTNVRANSSAFWRNSASDYGNVAGTFSTGLTQLVENYPLNYCGVGSTRVAGVNNIELPTVASEGVRWDPTMPYETTGTGEMYFPITISSVLGRAGMTYAAYGDFKALYPTLNDTDIFGLNRLAQAENEDMTLKDDVIFTKVKKDNSFIEIGARVMNGTFEVKLEYQHVMTRLFVTTTERLPTADALKLQNNTLEAELKSRYDDKGLSRPASGTDAYKQVEDDVEMYKQMGSSFLNPFHRFGDALEYIIKVRKEMTQKYDVDHTIGDYFKDVRFEIFVCGGTFYPFRDAHGRQGETRANTFVIPEEVTVVGGVDHQASGHAYCQETTGTVTVAGLTLNPASTFEIRSERQHMDRNGNNVKEPWELKEQTILSGEAVQNDQHTNVYHVITCFPDVDQVGQLPTRKNDAGSELPAMPTLGINPRPAELLSNIESESRASRDKRTIIIDGVTITGGHANKIDHEDELSNFQKLTYFRGGGILVEGNWDNTFNESSDLPEVLGVAKRNIPLMLTACNIKDNEAGNGGGVYTNGTFYSFSCHFTKNLAIGPETPTDQNYIPWSAGGAIANNYEVHLWNSLFDNNEAQRGLPITNGTITNADARQGYGGTISCSETGLARIGNCDFVRNKAVAFPALYNFIDNNLRAKSTEVYGNDSDPANYGRGWHFAVNSIFWGNTATASTVAASTTLEDDYYDDLYGDGWEDLRKPWHVANFGPKLDVATLTFCSYQEGTGREGTVWYSNHDRAKSAPIKNKGDIDGLSRLYAGDFVDVLDEYFGYYPDGNPGTPYYKKVGEQMLPDALTSEDLWLNGVKLNRNLTTEEMQQAVTYNYNLLLESENNVPGGPYFVQPSLTAGVDGYMETADWLVARLNNSVDTGWGYLKQKVTQEGVSSLFNTVLQKGQDADDLSDTNPRPSGYGDDLNNYLEEQYEQLYGEGFYNLHSKNIYNRFKDIGFPNLLPIGDDYYMEYSRDGVGEATNMRRISTHPKAGVQDVFIDMGIYEYQYVQLVTAGDEIDVIWVAETETAGPLSDGSTWERATSDLQGAIEKLLLSRNNHDKMIKLKGGTYSPTRMTQDGHKAFFINVPSKQDGIMMPKVLFGDDDVYVKSFTFRGGYPSEGHFGDMENLEEERNIDRNPVTFSMQYEVGNQESQLEHLFIIEDAELKATFANALKEKNPSFLDRVMPIAFEGITFTNPYGHNHVNGGSALYYKEQYQTVASGSDYSKSDHLLKAESYKIGDDTYYLPKLLVKNCTFMASGKDCGVDKGISAVKIEKGGGEALFVNCLFHSNSGAPIEGVNTKLVNCTSARNGNHITLTDVVEEYYDGTSVNTFGSGVYNSIIWMDDEAQEDDADKKMWEGDINMGSSQKDLGPGDDHNMKHNAFTEWRENPDTHVWEWWYPLGLNMIYGTDNIRLSPDNNNVLYGPCFVDPEGVDPGVGTAEERLLAKKLSRDFRLDVSARTVNKADVPTYLSLVPFYPEERIQKRVVDPSGDVYFHSVQRHDRPATVQTDVSTTTTYNPQQLTEAHLRGTETVESLTDDANYPYKRTVNTTVNGESVTDVETKHTHTEYELGFNVRLNGAGLERGPYECTAVLQRVLYVRDGADGRKDGTSWEHAFEIENLQRALNVASVYSLTTSPRERAYVFVQAASTIGEVLNVRDGVSVYGGITNLLYEVEKDGDVYTDPNIEAYLAKMKADRNSVATKGTTHNVVSGLVVDNKSLHTDGFLLNGFWIQGGNTSETPVDMTKGNTILENDIITGNNVTASGKPVVVIGDEDGSGSILPSLLYNTLIYGNTVDSGAPVVKVNAKGYALNNTIVATNAGETSLAFPDGWSDGEKQNHSQNNIAVTEPDGTRQTMFAPYLRPVNKGGNNGLTNALPIYLTEYKPYWYQLHEQSDQIDTGIDDNGSGEGSTARDGGNTIAKLFPTYVDFATDRDVLGNPRRLNGRVDNGCFETWLITGNKFLHNLTDASYTANYGGHLYPHTGSVLYLNEAANLVVNTDEGTPLFTSVNPLSPSYVLLKKGASVYGQGNTLRFAYVAAEKAFSSQQYALMAFPFDMYPQDAMTIGGSAGTLTQSNKSLTAYTYDSYRRSRYEIDRTLNPATGYNFLETDGFHEENSACWETVDTKMDATYGWLLDFGSSQTVDVRFTGWSETEGSFVYAEDGTDHKTVSLTQYNANALGAYDYPKFTRLEHMGWNLKGQPWLVSQFVTGGTNPNFNMDVPHLFYSMNGDGSYNYANYGAGQFYTRRSWDVDVNLGLGEGFFTQTAIIDDQDDSVDGIQELLTFKRPVYSGAIPTTPVRQRVAIARMDNETRGGSGQFFVDDVVDVYPQANAETTINYHLGRDGVKWFAFNPSLAQIYVETVTGSKLSLLAAAPVETDIDLGVTLPKDGSYVISLPNPETYSDYESVWLIDKLKGTYTNLLSDNYILKAEAGDISGRLKLRFGGIVSEDQMIGPGAPSIVKVTARNGRISLRGIGDGETIRVYNASGILVYHGITSDITKTNLADGVYIIHRYAQQE